MEEGALDVEGKAQTQSLDSIKNSLDTSSKSLIEGITESNSLSRESFTKLSEMSYDVGEKGWFNETLTKLLGFSEERDKRDQAANDLLEATRDSLNDMKVLDETTEKERSINKKKRGKVGKDVKIDELKQLPYEYATLGAVLASVMSKDNDKKNKKGDGIQGFFKGLMEGIGGIAALGVALLVFAGATLIFNFVDWGKALVGLLAFTAFTLGMVQLAKSMGKKETKKLKEFAEASLMMSAALGVFAVSLYIVSAVVSSKAVKIAGKEIIPKFSLLKAIEGVGVFLLFIAGIALVSHLLSKENKNLESFAKASLIMSAALGVFAISLWLVSAMMQMQDIKIGSLTIPKFDLAAAFKGLGMFALFITGLALISNLASSEDKEFESFAKASILMSASLVIFSFALIIVSNIFKGGPTKFGPITLPAIDLGGALAGLGAFGGFILAFTGLAILANKFGGDVKQFVVASILMSVSLVVFSISMIIVSNIFSGVATQISGVEGMEQGINLPKVDLGGAIAGIASFVIFVGAFIGLSVLANSFAPNLAIFVGVSMLMSVSLVLFSVAMVTAGIAGTGGKANILGKEFSAPERNGLHALAAIGDMTAFMLAFIGLGAMFLIPFAGQAMMAGLLAASVALTSIAITTTLFAKAMMMAGGVIKGGEFEIEGKKYKMEPYDPVAVNGMFDVMKDFMTYFAEVADAIGIKGAIVVAILGKSMMPILDAMDKMIDIVLKAAQHTDEINKVVNGTTVTDENGNVVTTNILYHLMDPVVAVINGLVDVSNKLGIKGAIALRLVTESMVPIIDAMGKMLDIVVKAATLKAEGMEFPELVDTANRRLNLMMLGDGNIAGFMPTFVDICEAAKDTSKKGAQAVQSMPPVIEALGGLIDVIAKAGELDPVKIQNGVFGLTAAANFLKTFCETISSIIPGGVGGKLKSFFTGDPEKQIQQAHEYLQPGGLYYNIFEDLANIAKKFDGKGFENLGKVSVVGAFTTDLLKSSEHLKDILGNIQKGIEKFKNPAAINVIADGISNIANAGDISGKFDPIYQLIEKQVQLKTVADEMDRIANAYKKLSKADVVGGMGNAVQAAVEKAKSIFPGFGKKKGEEGASLPDAENGESTGLKSVEEILNEWYLTGVNIKPQPGAAPARPNMLNV